MTNIQHDVFSAGGAAEARNTSEQAGQPSAATRTNKKTAGLPTAAASAGRRGAQLATSKSDIVLKMLRSAKGATVAEIMEATAWQAHSVRGFLSGTVRKKLNLNLEADVGKDGVRRYRIPRPTTAG
ncbi:MAG: DUF3489 domain-containing protein [Mesorhizobium sp.]